MTIHCSDPLMTAQEHTTLCTGTNFAQNQALYGLTGDQITLYVARRSVESGGRQDNYASNAFRQVGGVKGAITSAWTYDAYGQVGITQFQDIEGDFLGNPQINNALNVVPGPGGAPTCESVISGADTTCVPWNVWVPGGVNATQLQYLTVPATFSATAKEYIADASVTGDLGKMGAQLPTATSGLNVNFGTEYRTERYDFSPDFVYLNGFQAGGAPSKAIAGGFHVWEAFTEARLPLVDDKPGAYRLSLEAGYRYSSYSLGFDTNTYKIGLNWAPIEDVRLRGGYNRAVRAPNLDELYEPAVVGAGGTADPCWGPINPATGFVGSNLTPAQCASTGVTAAQYGHISVNPAAQINTLVGGNTTLVPETADTYTYGVVFQPRAIPNLVASLDAYDIKIKKTIISLTSNTIINDCAVSNDPASCALIHRGPTGSLWLNTNNFVQATFLNIGNQSTKGIDLATRYRLDLGHGHRLGFNLAGTYAREFLTQPLPTAAAYDCKGYWGSTCNAPLPSWRHVLNTDWVTPWAGLDVTVRWRYIGSSSVDRSSPNPQLAALYYLSTAHIPAYNYVDLSLAIPFGNSVDFRLGINNIADKNPPLILNGALSDCPNTTCNDNSWAGTYDTLGRYVYGHVSVKF
ncbi:MAG: TonB-dependent receptor [Gammaproteobacteria bacterium]|nr:MAG: TonB-dependent receptor [Gammaproteobacteria bacterium]